MEVMPHHADPRWAQVAAEPLLDLTPRANWREALPVLRGLGVTLRELCASDAPSLVAHLTTAEVSRFISPPPADARGFERFIAWTHRERAAGRYACFAIVPDGQTDAVGLFQIRRLEGRDGVAEWGFILGQAFWGSGVFLTGASRVIDFAFESMGLQRLEARAAIANGRGNGALAKLGAVREAVLRQSFERHGVKHDQALWAVLRGEWGQSATPRGSELRPGAARVH